MNGQTKRKPPTRMTSLHIMQWNARSLNANGNEFLNFLYGLTNPPNIICLQETWLDESKEFTIDGYSSHRTDRKNRTGGGVAIFIANGIAHRSLTITSDVMEVAAVQIFANGTSLSVCNIYNVCATHSIEDFSKILQQFPTGSKPFMCGDFNSHHTLWGSRKIDQKGAALASFIEDKNLVSLNDGSATYISSAGASSALDLTITSPDVAAKCNWSVVSTTTLGSDHHPVITSLSITASTERNSSKRWNFKRADWSSFTKMCAETITEDLIAKDIEKFNENVTRAIIAAAEAHIPTVRAGAYKPGIPWWNDSCATALAAKEAAWERANQSRNPDDYALYTELRNKSRATMRQAEKEHWREHCSSIDKNTTSRDLWKKTNQMLKRNSKAKPGMTLSNKEGEVITDPKSKADLFADHYESVSSDKNLQDSFLQHRKRFEEAIDKEGLDSPREADNLTGGEEINRPYSLREMKSALKAAKDTAVGADRISVSMLRHLPDPVLVILLKLFNESWIQGLLPTTWKHSLIVPLLKPGKIETKPESHRPISLTPVLCKILERMLKGRLSWYLESNDLLAPNQIGFRRKRGTMDNIVRLENTIQSALKNKSFAMAVTLDLEKAYDLIWIKGLIYQLRKIGIRGNTLKWITSFLTDRSAQVVLNGVQSRLFRSQNGSPQGSVISPLLFIILVNEIALKRRFCLTGMYADDKFI